MGCVLVPIRSYFVQYRFIIPDTVKHSSYTYQKLFRAIYGYTQAVYKSSGKNYHYHRAGILSNYPYLRPGKNCVIIPPAAFQSLQEFFKTGRNPTHNWEAKGDWKCTYFLNEKDTAEKDIILALENLMSRKFVLSGEAPVKLVTEVQRAAEKGVDGNYRALLIKEAQGVCDLEWFKQTYQTSPALNEFYSNFKRLKNVSVQPSTTPQIPSITP